MILAWDQSNFPAIASYLISGEVVVVPTDTIYGTLALAKLPESVQKVYDLKGRSPKKPVIILISDLKQLQLFNVSPSHKQSSFLKKYWPGKVSVILPCPNPEFQYLHRGTNSLAFRLPDNQLLRDLISLTGPLVAPSANPEGKPPAKDVAEAQNYFSNSITLYIDDGEKIASPSTLISLLEDQPTILRK